MKSHLANTSDMDESLSLLVPCTIMSNGIIPRFPHNNYAFDPRLIPSSEMAYWHLPTSALNLAILSVSSLSDNP